MDIDSNRRTLKYDGNKFLSFQRKFGSESRVDQNGNNISVKLCVYTDTLCRYIMAGTDVLREFHNSVCFELVVIL